MSNQEVIVSRHGIKIRSRYFWDVSLVPYIGSKVRVEVKEDIINVLDGSEPLCSFSHQYHLPKNASQ